jgi:hypothetical protein
MTSDGGTVHMDLSADGRWVLNINIRTSNGTASTSEVDRRKIQIVTSKFIYRSGTPSGRSGSTGRCVKPPCRGSVATGTSSTIRGTFRASDSLKGTYTALTASNSPSGSRSGTVRRYTGTYVAWPAGLAPCP